MSRAGGFAALALVAALLTGGVAGYALGNRPHRQRMKEMTMLGLSRSALLDSLRATPEQRTRIDSILDLARARSDSAVEGMVTIVRGATGQARDQVRALLTPEQRTRFDSMLTTTPETLPRSPMPPP